MCIRCVSNLVIESIEENYNMNREEIIGGLYNYFSINDKFDFGNNEDGKKHKQCYLKLKDILRMIENAEDKNDILQKLEILEVTMDFLQRHVKIKEINFKDLR